MDRLIKKLEEIANSQGMTIYNICHRNAGWAVQFHDKKKQKESKDFREGLTIHKYYATFGIAIKEELERLEHG